MKSEKEPLLLMRDKHLHFMPKTTFYVDVPKELDWDGRREMFNRYAKDDNIFVRFDDEFRMNANRLKVIKGLWEWVPDDGPRCECEGAPPTNFKGQEWHEMDFQDWFQCESCGNRTYVTGYYAKFHNKRA